MSTIPALQVSARTARLLDSAPGARDQRQPPRPLTMVEPEITDLDYTREHIERGMETHLGFPCATDIDFSPLTPLFLVALNNLGDPAADPVWPHHTMRWEREVVNWMATLFRADPVDQWGYVTTGGTEGTMQALRMARELHPNGILYYSTAAHYSVPKIAHALRIPSIVVEADHTGQMHYGRLRALARRNAHSPAIVVATCGTTMTEAVDDIERVHAALTAAGITSRYVHVDAALSGVPMALLGEDERPVCLDMSLGLTDSISISGHKFLGLPMPCGVLIARRSMAEPLVRPVAYTQTTDTTLLGSRSGHTAMALWWVTRRYGRDGLHRRAENARANATYLLEQLVAHGHTAWRNPHSMTVVLRRPPQPVVRKWALAVHGDWSHAITMPGVTRDMIDNFVHDLTIATRTSAYLQAVAPAA
ncbi:histidine decarboxylase [Longispora sp. NPDC051575]|uniref:histidine decarboxylase n=1 Tax=Longispora sp. NPDC051575 TaxID=3154943 RepID=UPI0034297131